MQPERSSGEWLKVREEPKARRPEDGVDDRGAINRARFE
eukprot:COSAG02_NODE_17391_length_1007_cov_1.339207_2_plen_38_part_01